MVIESKQENEFLKAQMLIFEASSLGSVSGPSNYWIGLTEYGAKRNYEWVNTEPLVFGNKFTDDPWKNNEPNTVVICFVSLIIFDSNAFQKSILGIIGTHNVYTLTLPF